MADSVDAFSTFFNSAREEMLLKIRQRDGWLKHYMLTLAIIVALVNGIAFGGVQSVERREFIYLVGIVSLIFSMLYRVEDVLIGQLSRYIAEVSSAARSAGLYNEELYCWDSSEKLSKYAKGGGLKLRAIYQVMLFIISPCLVVAIFLKDTVRLLPQSIPQYVDITIFIAIPLAFAFLIIICGYMDRYAAGGCPV